MNVEGLSASKASILLEMGKEQHCLCLQETHRSKNQGRPRIPGMAIVAERPHNKHGSSVFIRDGLKVNNISICEEENVELITVELPGIVVHSMYEPPHEPFRLPALGFKKQASHRNRTFEQPHYTGDTQQQTATGNLWSNGALKQPVTHTQRETTEIIQQCNMKEGIQPRSHLCTSNILDMCENMFWIQFCVHRIALYV